jgi:3-methyladenine DNA glycosylase AlkD
MQRLSDAFEARRDPGRGYAMAVYMRRRFPFFGIPAQERLAVYRQVSADLPPWDEKDLRAVALACWALPEREYQYFAVTLLRSHIGVVSPGFLPSVEQLISTKPWWDTVDELAQHVVGPMVAGHPELRTSMDAWIASDDLWLARTAILHQNRYRDRTDPELLFSYCLRRADDTDFFIRKAIGWALREYSKTNPDAVLRFVVANSGRLSGLSKREALRLISR